MPNNIINNFPSIQQLTEQLKNSEKSSSASTLQGKSFEQILNERTSEGSELRFSKHASMRMQTRQIDLTENQWERLEGGVEKAGEKGIRESLVMVDNLAFIVNISNNTVITAVGEGEDKIFTNIDGAIIT
jgi:flagellar operon protein